MVRLEDRAILERDAHDEFNNPLPQKICDDRTIYLSRNNYGQPNSITGIVSSTDFGLSVKGVGPHHGCIQAEPYRAPEVILDAGWTYSSDIWNLGVMVCFRASPSRERLWSWQSLQLWDLLENKILFEAIDPLKTEYDDQSHLAHITALLGPPPKELLAQGKRTEMFYDSAGKYLKELSYFCHSCLLLKQGRLSTQWKFQQSLASRIPSAKSVVRIKECSLRL